MSLHTIYLICAVAGGTVLVLRLILMLIGVDHSGAEVDVPADVSPDLEPGPLAAGGPEGDVGGSVNYLSIQSLAGFFTMFGLVGMGLLQIRAGALWSLAGALAAGLVTAWASAMIVFNLQRLQSEGTLVLSNAIGQQGVVYLSIPEQGSGVVSVAIQGALRQLDAISADGQKIPTGAVVRVTGVAAGRLVVVADSAPGKPSSGGSK